MSFPNPIQLKVDLFWQRPANLKLHIQRDGDGPLKGQIYLLKGRQDRTRPTICSEQALIILADVVGLLGFTLTTIAPGQQTTL